MLSLSHQQTCMVVPAPTEHGLNGLFSQGGAIYFIMLEPLDPLGRA